jgi:hypothetical protein
MFKVYAITSFQILYPKSFVPHFADLDRVLRIETAAMPSDPVIHVDNGVRAPYRFTKLVKKESPRPLPCNL